MPGYHIAEFIVKLFIIITSGETSILEVNILELFAIVVGALLFIAAPVAIGALCLLLLGGILWSPVAAVICGIIARSRGLEAIDRYIVAGFTSSCCLFGPWVYLVSRMKGDRLPADHVIVAYWVLFLLWGFGTWAPGFALSVTYFWIENPEFGPFSANADQYDPRGTITVITIATLVPAVAFILWGLSLFQMIRLYRKYRRGALRASRSALIESVYSRPCKLTAASFVLFLFGCIYILVFYLR